MRFWDGFFVILIILLNKFSYNNVIDIVGVIKKDKNFCYICYIIDVIEKYKYDLLCLLYLKITNTYTYNLNLYNFFI